VKVFILTQIQAKYNIPKTTLRKWKNNNIIEERIKMLSQRGYTNHLLSEGVLTSIWKYENGNLATVPARDILYKIDDDDRLHNNLVTALMSRR
jgi:muconolactone delta-isomerase